MSFIHKMNTIECIYNTICLTLYTVIALYITQYLCNYIVEHIRLDISTSFAIRIWPPSLASIKHGAIPALAEATHACDRVRDANTNQ